MTQEEKIIIKDFETSGHLSKHIPQAQSDINNLAPDFFKMAIQLNRIAQDALYATNIKTEDEQEYIRALLFFHILRTYQGFIHLAKIGLQEQSIMLLRVLMEAVFKIKAINDHHDLSDEFMKDFKINRKTYGQNLKKLIECGLMEFEEKQVREWQNDFEEIEKIKKDGYKIRDWAKEANMENMYFMLYPMFSQPIHSNPHQLDKYLLIDENDNPISPNPFPLTDQLKKNIHLATTLLLIATDSVDDMLKKERRKATFTRRLHMVKRKLLKLADQT